jgi:hypothetical protein
MLKHCLWTVCVALGGCLAMAQGGGRITGTVWDENGQLVNDAKLCVMVKSGNTTSINCNVARTDRNGQFQIENLKIDEYDVFAVNEEEGYSIQNQSPGEKVLLTEENSAPDITIRLRPRGAVLLGAVTDKFSGKPVRNVWVNYLDLDGKASGTSLIASDGRIRVPIPTECGLVIVVSAKRYKGWVYTDPANPTRPVLRLHSGEHKTLSIQLEPDRND